MTLDEAIAVFDKSAYAQTEAWAVIRAELANARRWRFARDNWHDLCTATGIDTGGNLCVTEILISVGEHTAFAEGTLDAAIDAAIAQQEAAHDR